MEDKSPKLIKPVDIEILLDALEHLPLQAKKKLGVGMTYRSLIRQSKREKMGTIAKSTQGKHISNFRAFIHWLMEARVITEDPTCAVNIADYQPKTKTKVSFVVEEVQEITHEKHEAAITTPQNHWVPFIDLYAGLRLNETAQLYVDDIIKVNGILCFKVSGDRAGQSVKTASSVRYVPIHSKLIELGFLDYVEEVRSKGFDHLFPGQTWGKNGPGGNLSISLNKTHLRKRCGITDRRKSIGCLRHTFATWAAQSGLIPRVIKRILGHAEDNSVLQKHYIDPAEVPECKGWIERIEFPEMFAKRYVPGRFDKHFGRVKAKEEREGRRLTANGKTDRKLKDKPKKDKN